MISKEQIKSSLANPRQNFYQAIEDLYKYCMQETVYPMIVNHVMERARASRKRPNEFELIGYAYDFLKELVLKTRFGQTKYQAQMFIKTLWTYKNFNRTIYQQARKGYTSLVMPEEAKKKLEAEESRKKAEAMRLAKKKKKCTKCERTTCINRKADWDGVSKLKQKSIPSCFKEQEKVVVLSKDSEAGKALSAIPTIQKSDNVAKTSVVEEKTSQDTKDVPKYKGRPMTPEEQKIINKLKKTKA